MSSEISPPDETKSLLIPRQLHRRSHFSLHDGRFVWLAPYSTNACVPTWYGDRTYGLGFADQAVSGRKTRESAENITSCKGFGRQIQSGQVGIYGLRRATSGSGPGDK